MVRYKSSVGCIVARSQQSPVRSPIFAREGGGSSPLPTLSLLVQRPRAHERTVEEILAHFHALGSCKSAVGFSRRVEREKARGSRAELCPLVSGGLQSRQTAEGVLRVLTESLPQIGSTSDS